MKTSRGTRIRTDDRWIRSLRKLRPRNLDGNGDGRAPNLAISARRRRQDERQEDLGEEEEDLLRLGISLMLLLLLMPFEAEPNQYWYR